MHVSMSCIYVMILSCLICVCVGVFVAGQGQVVVVGEDGPIGK